MVHGSAGSTEYGTNNHLWMPATVGRDFEFTKILQAARAVPRLPHGGQPHRLLAAPIRVTAEEVGADHFRSSAVFLTAAHPKQTEGSDIRNGTSIDQLYAQQLTARTRRCRRFSCASRTSTRRAPAATTTAASTWTRSAGPIADHAAADDARPAHGVRGAVRHRRHVGRSRASRNRVNRSILDGITRDIGRLQRNLDAQGPRPARPTTWRTSARSSGASRRSRPTTPRTARARAAGGADRRARLVGRARQADVRPAGAGLRRRRHPRLDVQAEPRHQQPRVRRERLQHAVAFGLAPRRTRRDDRGPGQDQPLSPDACWPTSSRS